MTASLPTVAVIDLGSNSARLVVFRLSSLGHLETLRDARASLKLIRHIDGQGHLDADGVATTADILVRFRGLVGRDIEVIAVATAALRETTNSESVIAELARRSAVKVTLLSGDDEAELACLGAVHGLPVEDGIVLDIGGGSLELALFEARRRVTTWTFPLGALRVSDALLRSDPPSRSELRAVARLVNEEFADRLPPVLARPDGLVGTGGTARGAARIHRAHNPHLLDRLHGYCISATDIDGVLQQVARLSADRRKRIAGMGGRADSVVGGVAVIRAVMDYLGADRLTVSAHGLREGVALRHLGGAQTNPEDVRTASLTTVARRFSTYDDAVALRRATVAAALLAVLEPQASAEVSEALRHAATISDAGRALDYSEGFAQAAAIILAADLLGFGQLEVARVAAILEKASEPRSTLGHYRPAFAAGEISQLESAAVVLCAADEIEAWLPQGSAIPALDVLLGRGTVTVMTKLIAPCRPALGERLIKMRFQRDLIVTDGTSGAALVPIEVR